MNMHTAIALSGSLNHDRWTTCRREFGRAREAVERYEIAAYKPATDRLNALTGPYPPTKVDLVAKSGAVATYTVWQSDWYEGMLWFEPVRQARRAYDEHCELVRHQEQATGWAGISDKMEKLDTREGDARARLMDEPAPDAEALAYKLKLALENDEFWDSDRSALLRDLNRLAI